MPFLQRDRTPVDAQREADRSYQSNLILYAVLLVVSVVIILFYACLGYPFNAGQLECDHYYSECPGGPSLAVSASGA